MRDRLEVLCCDAPGCDARISGPASLLEQDATRAGWQAEVIIRASEDEDGPDVTHTDRCPAHHAAHVHDQHALETRWGLRPGALCRRRP